MNMTETIQLANETITTIDPVFVLLWVLSGLLMGRLGAKYIKYRYGTDVVDTVGAVMCNSMMMHIYDMRCPECLLSHERVHRDTSPGKDAYSEQAWQHMLRGVRLKRRKEMWSDYIHCEHCKHYSRVRHDNPVGWNQVALKLQRMATATEGWDLSLVDYLRGEEE